MPDGTVVDGQSWRTTPYEVASGISSGLANTSIIAKVNDSLWDLDRPIEEDCSLALLKFDDPDGLYVRPNECVCF
jgi:threonyl-tRNA synthetase